MALTKIGKEGITGISNSSNASAITINSSEQVGIGTTSVSNKLEVHSGDATNIVAKSTNGNGGYLNYSGLSSTGTTTFSVTHNGKIYVADGIQLGGTGAANYLGDYEEGTWTPTVNSGTITIETNSSKYIKVGNLVTVYTRIHSFSDNTSSNELILKTLPFTISTTNPEANIGSAWGRDVGDHRSMFFYPQVNSTTALAYYGGAGGTFNQVIHSNFNSSTDIIIRLHYITA